MNTSKCSSDIEQEQAKKSVETKRYHNDSLMLITILIASIITLLLYAVPDWIFLEYLIRDLVQFLLSILGIVSEPIPQNGEFITPMELRGGPFPFIEATEQTPGVFIPSTDSRFYITKTCTAMQAGSLLIGIIAVTETSRETKLKAIILTFSALFFMNILRITFHFWTITILCQYFNLDHDTAFFWGHDVSSKILGFIGTIILALIIEKTDVPIIDQFTDWLDYVWWRMNSIIPLLLETEEGDSEL
ncbi:MAG: heimdallarchaeosortase [Candidatus Thorarchaeota archaeon]